MSSVLLELIIREIREESERKPGDMDKVQQKAFWNDKISSHGNDIHENKEVS